MSKFTIDYATLTNKFNKRKYKLADVKEKITKVAFDIVRFKDDDNAANLWQIQSADDGDYIVALYDEEQVKTAATKTWEVDIDKIANKLDIFYKNDHLISIACDKLGIPSAEISKVKSYLPSKLASNKKLVSCLIKEMTDSAQKEVAKKYPELF